MINFLTVLFIVVGIIGILGLFAFSLCWTAHEVETLRDKADECEESEQYKENNK